MKKNQIKREFARFSPSLEKGLSKKEVEQRASEGAINRPSKKVEKSYLRMLFDNIFTPFNIALFVIAALFLFFMIYLNVTGRHDVVEKDFGISKFGFLIPAVVNSTIGSVQEIHGRRVLNKLKLLNQAKANVIREGQNISLYAEDIVLDDVMRLSAGEQCLADSILQEGEIYVDEGMLTGESDPIAKKKGDFVYAGSSILVGSGIAIVERVGDDTFAHSLSGQAKELPRHHSELMTIINRIIRFLAYAILVVVAVIITTLCIKITIHGGNPEVFGSSLSLSDAATWGRIVITSGAFAVGMIPEGLVLLTSVALMVSILKLARQKTLIQELYSLENLSRVDTICLDKTGTLTDGTMNVVEARFLGNEEEATCYLRHLLGAFSETNPTSAALDEKYGHEASSEIKDKIPFSSIKKHSGIVYENGDTILLGAPEYLLTEDAKELEFVKEKAKEGKRVLGLTKNEEPIAFYVIEDHIRLSAKETLTFFYENGVDIKIISGDNLLTVSKIASECGVKDVEKGISLEGMSLEKVKEIVKDNTIFARVSPEQKLAIVEALQENGHKVAMTGDGVNDILALRKANASITFAKATDAAKSCSDVVLLDNDFKHLKEVVGQGRRVVNNIERAAILFLMKTTAIIGLAFALIPFKKGQFLYSVENIYLLQTAVIGVGGFLLSLESHKEPIRGSFMRNVFSKALISGLLVLAAAIAPLILCRSTALFNGTPVISEDSAKSLISILTGLAGFVCCVCMCTPFTRYRFICLIAVILFGTFLVFALPTSIVGGKATSFSMFVSPDGNFFHAPFFQVAFQPWNSEVMIELHKNYVNYVVMGSFLLIAFPLYGATYHFVNKRFVLGHVKKESSNKN